ncbi:hypothetical protein SLS63_004650 [Diaporthe eres]|uniref:Uncharacterized protein n=1 Tax=Diaporthe eres TaxID=83184 RepID=A0ABR1PDW3_DIAER
MEDQAQTNVTSQGEGEIIGYADPWIASPGQTVSVKDLTRRPSAGLSLWSDLGNDIA